MNTKPSITAALTGLALASALLIGAPASAAPAAPQANVVELHVTWHVQDRTPPETALLRAFDLVKVNATPQKYTERVTLYRYALTMTRRGPKWEPKRAKDAPAAVVGLADLPAPGSSVTWKFGGPPLFPDWICKPGWYFLVNVGHAVSDTGTFGRWHLYDPYLKGHGAHHPTSSWGYLPPTKAEAIHIKTC